MKHDKRYWITPPELLSRLNEEFHFDFDPCPYPFKEDGIPIPWGKSNWVNPPFSMKDAINGHGPTAFAKKAIEEQKQGKSSVLIFPVQSYVDALLRAGAEIRPAGRVPWLDTGSRDPHKHAGNSALFILKGSNIHRKDGER